MLEFMWHEGSLGRHKQSWTVHSAFPTLIAVFEENNLKRSNVILNNIQNSSLLETSLEGVKQGNPKDNPLVRSNVMFGVIDYVGIVWD